MTFPTKQRLLWPAVTLGLAAILVVLAVLQYRWTGEVSKADEARMQASLQTSMVAMREDIYRELEGICDALRNGPESPSDELGAQYTRQLAEWTRTAAHPSLVAGVFLIKASGSQIHLARLNQVNGHFEDAAWPEAFGDLHEWMQSTAVLRLSQGTPGDSLRGPPPPRGGVRGPDAIARPPTGIFGGIGELPWLMDQRIPALVHPVVRLEPTHTSSAVAEPVGWVVVQLDSQTLREHILPELAEKHFAGSGGLIYQLAVLEAGGRGEVVYSSDPGFEKDAAYAPDARLNVFGLPEGQPGSRMNVFSLSEPPPDRPPRGGRDAEDRPPGRNLREIAASPGIPPQLQFIIGRDAYGRPARFEAIHYSPRDGDWQLIARHRSGSLDAAVAGLRRRNLALSFGVLLLLGATMGLIITAGARAHRLARLQMDFVASVSHELRTPVAAISSAADNMADGLVDNKEQVARYGTMIRGQSRQLIQLVEQILHFAAMRENRQRYNMRLLDPSEIVDAALGGTGTLLREAGIQLERMIEPGLPQVAGDLAALSQCLQNLITNAVKYGGERRWIGVQARTVAGPSGSEVRIAVSDRGIGIQGRELRRIFEPFYRSPSVTAAQIHGTGLGLPLVKRMVEAMNGRVTVSSEAGSGSSFVLHLPVAAPFPAPGKAATSAAAELPS